MPDTKITKKKMANHWHYHKFIYLLIVLLVAFGGDLAFQMTAYRAPNSRKVDIQLVSGYSDADFFLPYAEKALADGQAYDETLEEVNFMSLAYSGEEDDVYGAQKFMVMLGANEGHIYFVNRPLMEQLVYQGATLPLDDFIADGLLTPKEWMDLDSTRFHVTEDQALSELGERIYALPIGQLYGAIQDDIYYDVRDKYAVIMSFVEKPETSAVVLQSVIDQLIAPAPAWLSEAVDGESE